ncbi:MAG: HAMP domain-containing histidine kinase, partial [Clostridiales bacterium]|nr:HAMP domain-containing histidine kinase [Clostridiales bacterium]
MRNKIASARRSIRIAAIFSALVFLILALTMIITVTVTMFLYRRDILRLQRLEVTIPVYAGISVIVGTIMSRFAGKRPIGRIIEINEATKEVARGNFDVVVDEDIQATELREMAHSFNIMTRELAAKKLLHTDFIENVSHEFRTPLSAIEGYAILLRRKSVSDEMRVEYAKKILNNTQRLTALTGNILLLSRLEPGELILEKKPFSLDEQLREIILMLESEWTAKDLELDIELESITYSGSRELLYHVWHNLLTNAVKFSNKGGKIIIRLSSFP